MRYRAWQTLLCVGGAGLTWSRVAEQAGAPPAAQAVETVTAGARYGAGWLHRQLLGAHYRDLWTTPVRVAVLDLGGFAGGLTLVVSCVVILLRFPVDLRGPSHNTDAQNTA